MFEEAAKLALKLSSAYEIENKGVGELLLEG